MVKITSFVTWIKYLFKKYLILGIHSLKSRIFSNELFFIDIKYKIKTDKNKLTDKDMNEVLVVNTGVNINHLSNKNQVTEIILRDQGANSLNKSLLNTSITYSDKPEFCQLKCKTCKAEVKYTIAKIKYNSKIGEF